MVVSFIMTETLMMCLNRITIFFFFPRAELILFRKVIQYMEDIYFCFLFCDACKYNFAL